MGMDELREEGMPEEDGRVKILVRETNWLGDVLMSLPFLRTLREKHPGAHISVLVRPRTAAILQHHPGVDKLLMCDDEGRHRGMGLFNLAGDLRTLHYDVAYILPNSFSSALMMWLARIPERVGYATDGRSLLLTRALQKTAALRSVHETLLYLNLLGTTPEEAGRVHPRLELLPEEEAAARARLSSLDIEPEKPLVGMVPGAAYGTAKRWPAERFMTVAEWLGRECDAQIVLFGAGGEEAVARRVESAVSGRIVNFVGQTRLRELAALLKCCHAVVSNDTGGMHVAAAVGTPVVALFGPTNPVTTAPFGERHVLLRHPVDCSPCLLRHCPLDHRCMRAISVEEVFAAAGQAIEHAFGPR